MAPNEMRPFRSVLLLAPHNADTLGFVRALHGGSFAVLERDLNDASLRMADSGEFDLVAVYCPAGEPVPGAVATLAARRIPLLAVVPEATARVAAGCLSAGADACLAASADDLLVVAQANAVLRRHGVMDEAGIPGILQVGDLTVDVNRCEVERDGAFVPLTASEFRIIEYMARNAGRVLRPHEILNATSDEYEYLPRDAQEVFKVYVRRIRRKLEDSVDEPRYLVTVRGFGYRLEGGRQRAMPAPKVGSQTA